MDDQRQAPRREKHSRPVPGGRGFWWTDRLYGGHRIAQALLAGDRHVPAVRFTVDPEPDWVRPEDPRLPAAPRAVASPRRRVDP